jgi:putative transposase
MPWKETCPVNERMMFVADYERGELEMSALCRLYGISRKTGYKWLKRFFKEGPAGLEERSRAPLRHPNETPEEIRKLLIRARKAHRTWGPKKLLKWLSERHPNEAWPAVSTAGEILKRHGLVTPKRRRQRVPPYDGRLPKSDRPNGVWTSDFKGQFRTRNRQMCYPLTVVDDYSRFLLDCHAQSGTSYKETKPQFERLFREYGLPWVIQTDNGVPFASRAAAGLSRLSVWWLKLGIEPRRIAPGHPEQNGRHERMHRTLKEEAVRPPRENLDEQQQAFDDFRRVFNRERPHEALGLETPESVYEPSDRLLPDRAPEPEYPGHYEVRRVRTNGEIKFRGERVFISESLIGELVGLVEIDEGAWRVRFASLTLGLIDERTGSFKKPKLARKSK